MKQNKWMHLYVQGVDLYWKHRISAFYILYDIKYKNTNDGKYYLCAEYLIVCCYYPAVFFVHVRLCWNVWKYF